MRPFLQMYKGILLIFCVALVLLISDLENRRPAGKPVVAYSGSGSFVPARPGKAYKAGFAYFGPDLSLDLVWKGLFQGLREMGYVQDSNLFITPVHANGEIATLPTMIQSLDHQDLDVIVTFSTPCLTAALAAVKKKPVVFTYVIDPLAAGAGTSFTEHHPLVTGLGCFPPLVKTREAFLKLLPGLEVVGTLYNTSEANSRRVVEVMDDSLKRLGIRLEKVTVTGTNEVQQATQVLCAMKPDLIWIGGDNTAFMAFDAIIREADRAGIPVVINDPEFTDRGAVMAVGVDYYSVGYHTAPVLSRVLNGADPAGIPIGNYSDENISFNARKATTMGIRFPEELLAMAYGSARLNLTHRLRLAMLQYNESPITDEGARGILAGLKDLGLQEGKDFTLDIMNAQGDIATVSTMADAVEQGGYDLVFTISTPTLQAAIRKIRKTPVVFTCSAAPVAAGAGKTFSDHLPNVTGISTMGDFCGMAEYLRMINPGWKTAGTLFNQGEINSVNNKTALDSCCRIYGIDLVTIPVNNASEVAEASLMLCQRKIDVFCQVVDNTTASAFPTIAAHAGKFRIPLASFVGEQINGGAFLVVSRDYFQAGLDAVRLAARILNGQPPGSIPFEYVSRTNVLINPRTASAYGIVIPERLLNIATLVR